MNSFLLSLFYPAFDCFVLLVEVVFGDDVLFFEFVVACVVVAEVVTLLDVEFLQLVVVEELDVLGELFFVLLLEFIADFVHVFAEHGETLTETLDVALLGARVAHLAGEQFVECHVGPVLQVVLGERHVVDPVELVLVVPVGFLLRHSRGVHIRERPDFGFLDFVLDLLDVAFEVLVFTLVGGEHFLNVQFLFVVVLGLDLDGGVVVSTHDAQDVFVGILVVFEAFVLFVVLHCFVGHDEAFDDQLAFEVGFLFVPELLLGLLELVALLLVGFLVFLERGGLDLDFLGQLLQFVQALFGERLFDLVELEQHLAGGELVFLGLALVLRLGLGEFELALEFGFEFGVDFLEELGLLVEPGAHVFVALQLVLNVLLLLVPVFGLLLDFVLVVFVFSLDRNQFVLLQLQFAQHFVVVLNFVFQPLLGQFQFVLLLRQFNMGLIHLLVFILNCIK